MTTHYGRIGTGLMMFIPFAGISSAQEKPNILFIMSDDHAEAAISAYGSEISGLAPTPNIDRIASEGALFRSNFCCNSLSGPSRAAIMTGLHSHANGFMRNGNKFDGNQETLQKILHRNGWQTALIGKWHLNGKPIGFDHWEILNDQGEYYNPDFITDTDTVRVDGYVTDIITGKCKDWLDGRDKDRPFFLMMHHKACHRNWWPAERHYGMYDNVEFPVPETFFDDYAGRSAAEKQKMNIYRDMYEGHDLKMNVAPGSDSLRFDPWPHLFERMTPEQEVRFRESYGQRNARFWELGINGSPEELAKWKYQRYLQDYLSTSASLDESVGEMLDYLRDNGLLDNTIVVYCSDQSFYLGEHGWFDKRFMYEPSMKMPLMIRYPEMVTPGTEVTAMTQNIDFAPTFLDMCGIEVPSSMQGESFLPFMRGEEPEGWRDALYYHFYEHPGFHNVQRHYGIRTRRYKLMHFYMTDEWELYDLEADPDEMDNLYGKPGTEELTAGLKTRLKELQKTYGVPYELTVNPKHKEKASSFFKEKDVAERVDSVMNLMTLDEKIGQLVLFAGKGVVTGATESKDIEEYIAAGMCGGVFNIRTLDETVRLQKLAVESSRLGIPMLFGFDVIHGFRTIFPVNIGISSSWDIPAVERFARISAEEASGVGVNWTFSPMCDISYDPRWGRVSEGCGEDPFLASAVSAAMVRGYQGTDLADPSTVMACVKHFAAYGAAEGGRDYNTVDMSERTFRDMYLPPYRAGINAGAATVMTSFNEYDGVPATANKYLLQDLLRDELGFNGLVVTDYTAVMELVPHGVAADGKDAAAKAFDAGVGMDMVSNLFLLHGKELVEEGRISEEQIDGLCRQVLGMKFRLGLFDDPYRYCVPGRDTATAFRPEHLEEARSLARSSMVLLENNDALPLNGNEKIALVGPFGNAPREMLGSWVLCPEPGRAVTFLDGLRARFGEQNVSFAQGCRPDKEIDGGIRKAVSLAKKSDVVLLTLGVPQGWTGEAASLTSIKLPEVQTRLLEEIRRTGKPVVILLVTARPLDISYESTLADAVLVTWNPGTMAGAALADVVSGDYNPSGKLTMSFPREVGQIPVHYNAKNTGRPVGYASMSSQKYTSRYMFTPNSPLYPFGYGLSYTEFSYSDIRVDNPSVRIGDNVVVHAVVTNAGKLAGEEVVQLYVRDLVGSVTRPLRELKGFEKISLEPGESRTVTFVLTPEHLSFCRGDMTTGQEPGEYHVWIGGSSDADMKASFRIVPQSFR